MGWMMVLLLALESGSSMPAIIMGGLVGLILLLLVLLMRARTAVRQSSPMLPHIPADAPTAPIPPRSGSDALPSAGYSGDRMSTATTQLSDQANVPTAAQCRTMEAADATMAGRLWLRRGDLESAGRCYERAGMHQEAAMLMRAIGLLDPAMEHFRETLRAVPDDEHVRLAFVETLLDAGHPAEARDVATAVVGSNGKTPASAKYFEAVGCAFEGAGLENEALANYNRALALNEAMVSALLRTRYLGDVLRLRDFARGGADGVVDESIDSADQAPTGLALRTIVGHLALGGLRGDSLVASVRSPTNRAVRFRLDRILTTTEAKASFAATDRILDLPVVLRVHSIAGEVAERLPAIEARLRRIASLNCPHLARLTYADRDDTILRVVYEYLPGGNLSDFLARLPAMGIPLVVRLALQVIAGVEASHKEGVIHGALSIENVLIGYDQRLKLTDFALTTPQDSSEADTDPAAITGGESTPPKNKGVQADLTMFAGLTERMLQQATARMAPPSDTGTDYQAELRGILEQIRNGEIADAENVRTTLDSLLERCVGSAGTRGRSSEETN